MSKKSKENFTFFEMVGIVALYILCFLLVIYYGITIANWSNAIWNYLHRDNVAKIYEINKTYYKECHKKPEVFTHKDQFIKWDDIINTEESDTYPVIEYSDAKTYV